MSAIAGNASAGGELVPIADRLRYMSLFRIAFSAGIAGFVLFSSGATWLLPTSQLLLGTGAYLFLSLAGHALWTLARGRGITLFGAMLILDGFFLAAVSYGTGGSASPLRYLILVHLIAVALLASYRTGLKLALWHSVLLWVVYQLQEMKVLEPVSAAAPGLPGSELERLLVFAAMFWFVAVVTASFSAVNERELRRRRFDLEALAAMAGHVEGASDPLAVAETLLGGVVETFDFERAVLLGAAEDGSELSVLAQHGEVGTLPPGVKPGESSALARALSERRTLLVASVDPVADPALAAVMPDARNLVLVPLSADGRAFGLIVIEHALRTGSRIERRVIGTVERFASHGALALRNSWLVQQLQRTAETDGLTGISNRRAFERELDTELSRAARGRDDVSLVLFDLDRFKELNDTHGHQAGDEVLRRTAAVLARESRDFDTVARYGGEELAVILPRAGREEALAVADRLRVAITEEPGYPPVTASGGVATFPADAVEAGALVRAADEALYVSKHAGRDRVSQARELAAEPAGEASIPVGPEPAGTEPVVARTTTAAAEAAEATVETSPSAAAPARAEPVAAPAAAHPQRPPELVRVVRRPGLVARLRRRR